MRVKFLASSSTGNCALVEAGSARFLFDAGLSFRKISLSLEAEGLSPRDIAAIFVTHEHADHVSGLSGFAALNTPIYATRGTALAAAKSKGLNWKLIEAPMSFKVEGLSAESFPIPHDATDPVGFSLDDGAERLVWALDLGHLSAPIKAVLRSATILVLESNYSPEMLEADTKRPFFLKQRIKGRHGHLSNDEAFEFLTTERNPNWRQIHLAHLSRQCNDAEALQARYAALGMPVEVVDPIGERVA